MGVYLGKGVARREIASNANSFSSLQSLIS